jgi:hypothetical protein
MREVGLGRTCAALLLYEAIVLETFSVECGDFFVTLVVVRV